MCLTNIGNSFSGPPNPLVSRSDKFPDSSVEDDDGDVFWICMASPAFSTSDNWSENHNIHIIKKLAATMKWFRNSPILRSIGFSKESVRQLSLVMKKTWKQIKGKRKIPPVLLNGDLLRLQLEPVLWISPLAVFQEVRPRLQCVCTC